MQIFLADEIDKHGRVCLSVAAGEGMYVQTPIRVTKIVEKDVYIKNTEALEPEEYTGALQSKSEITYNLPQDSVTSMSAALQAVCKLDDAQEIVYVVGDKRTPVWRAPLDAGWLENVLRQKVTLQVGGAFEILTF
jgi:hypothetical protein